MISREYIETRLARLHEVEAMLSSPGAASNQKTFRDLVREHAALKKLAEKAERYFRLLGEIRGHRELIGGGTDDELAQLAASEIAGMEAELPRAERELVVTLLPPDPNAGRNAIMEIRAGTGGEEAALFAADLFRMYGRYADAKGWKIGLIDASASDIGGFKEVVFAVAGEGAYGHLQFEGGGHRVQRIPVTEAAGRIHTSAATVAVFPEAEEEDEIEIKPEELRIDLFCSSGPGGQSVNTTYSAVRITHLPSGVVVQSQDERSQQRNRQKAMAVLRSRLLDHKRRVDEEKMGTVRRTMIGSGDRSERIRTYNFPQNRLTDHRINLTLYTLDRCMQGEIDDVIQALREHDVRARLEHLGDKR